MIDWRPCRYCGYPVDARRGVHEVCEQYERYDALDDDPQAALAELHRVLDREDELEGNTLEAAEQVTPPCDVCGERVGVQQFDSPTGGAVWLCRACLASRTGVVDASEE